MRAVDSFRHQRAQPTGRGVGHGVFGTMTAAAWTLYAYLWLPAITLVAWLLGLRTAWVQAVLQRASVDLDDMWLMLGLVMLLGCALVLWAEQQRKRFTGVERRLRARDASAEQVATSLGAPVHLLADLQGGQVLTVHHDAHGHPVRVDRAAARPTPAAAAGVPEQRRARDRAATSS